jgi:small GTP-binding protein
MLPHSRSVHCRVVVIGDSTVGKTSLLNHLTLRPFDPQVLPTVISDFRIHTRDINGISVELQLWDTAGQEKFRSIAPIYFRNAAAAVVVYDCTSRETFDHVPRWIEDFREIAGPETVVALAANKTDLRDISVVSRAEALELAASGNYLFLETSARTGAGIQELSDCLISSVLAMQAPPKMTRLMGCHAEEQMEERPCLC